MVLYQGPKGPILDVYDDDDDDDYTKGMEKGHSCSYLQRRQLFGSKKL
jgi:hypothetical protein